MSALSLVNLFLSILNYNDANIMRYTKYKIQNTKYKIQNTKYKIINNK